MSSQTRPPRRVPGLRLLLTALAAVGILAVLRVQPWSAPPAKPASYVGAAKCATCHAAEAAAWKGSDHERAMQVANDSTVLGDFGDREFQYAGTTTRFFRRDGRFVVNTDGPDGRLADFVVRYTFGVRPLQQYLIEMPGGRFQALGIAWDTRPRESGGQRWFHLHPGERVTHLDELHWTKRAQNWNHMCAECHSTDLRKNYDATSRTYATTYAEIDVACEACHGPGSNHVAWAGRESGWKRIAGKGLVVPLDERRGVTWKPDPKAIAAHRSAPRTTAAEIEMCARCHSRRSVIAASVEPGRPLADSHLPALLRAGLYEVDGQIRDEVYEYGSFLQSRMNAAGVTCSDCHDPHGLGLRAPGDETCASCHAPSRFATREHHHHAPDSPGASCISCHMPQHTYMEVDVRRDHSFRVPRPDLTEKLGVPNACASCHSERPASWAAGAVRRWLGRDARGFQDFAPALAAAHRMEPAAESLLIAGVMNPAWPAIARATAAEALAEWPDPTSQAALAAALRDPSPLVRIGALNALEAYPVDQRWPLASPLLRDSVRAVRVEAVGLLAAASLGPLIPLESADFERARQDYVAAQQANADQPEAHVNLGNLALARGEMANAENEYRTALALDPDWAPAYVNLADLLRQAGRDAECEAVLRQGIERLPEVGSLHHSLGLRYVRDRNLPAALASLERAVELDPGTPRYAYVYGVALESAGQRKEALRAVEAALRRAPGERSLLALEGQLKQGAAHP